MGADADAAAANAAKDARKENANGRVERHEKGQPGAPRASGAGRCGRCGRSRAVWAGQGGARRAGWCGPFIRSQSRAAGSLPHWCWCSKHRAARLNTCCSGYSYST
eukprot:SAG11_NODE_1156_length_5658_cov_10.848174_5_plen_106_part_00